MHCNFGWVNKLERTLGIESPDLGTSSNSVTVPVQPWTGSSRGPGPVNKKKAPFKKVLLGEDM